jgi:hypothetical protein
VKHASLHVHGFEFADAQQDSLVFSNIVGAFICLASELESRCIA